MLEWLGYLINYSKVVCGATTAFLHTNLTTKNKFNKKLQCI